MVERGEASGILSALTVLDLSEGIAGPFAAKLFADYGATVMKIEPPGLGDRSRGRGPFPDGVPNREASARFLYLNTNKLSITLDYENATGAAILTRLCEDADAVIEDGPTRRRPELGLDGDSLIARVPRLVITTISHAEGAEYQVGLHAFAATLAASWYAARTEHGQLVAVDGRSVAASLRGLAGGEEPLDVEAYLSGAVLFPVEHPVAGPLSYPGGPFLSNLSSSWRAGRAPLLGEHNEEVLGGMIGVERGDLVRLRGAGVI